MAQDEVDLAAREAVPRLARALRGVDEAGGHHLRAEGCDALLDAPLVALDALEQTVELTPVGLEPDPEDPDPRADRSPPAPPVEAGAIVVGAGPGHRAGSFLRLLVRP